MDKKKLRSEGLQRMYRKNLLPLSVRARELQKGKEHLYAVCHVPSAYYVGVTNSLHYRWKDHYNKKGWNLEDAMVLSWHETKEEAIREEMKWHLKGYHGAQGLKEKPLNRLLYG